jgi:phosphoglucosamine mutase
MVQLRMLHHVPIDKAGATVVAIHHQPDGWNINDELWFYPSSPRFAARVIAEKADFGIAHDGDADRCLAVDAHGEIVDGDAHS